MAGFFDGEGSVFINLQGKSNTLRIEVSCSQNTRTPLELYERYFNGHINGHVMRGRRSMIFQWKAYAQTGIDFLHEVRPFLIVKARSADEAMDMWSIRQDKEKLLPLFHAHKDRIHAERTSR